MSTASEATHSRSWTATSPRGGPDGPLGVALVADHRQKVQAADRGHLVQQLAEGGLGARPPPRGDLLDQPVADGLRLLEGGRVAVPVAVAIRDRVPDFGNGDLVPNGRLRMCPLGFLVRTTLNPLARLLASLAAGFPARRAPYP